MSFKSTPLICSLFIFTIILFASLAQAQDNAPLTAQLDKFEIGDQIYVTLQDGSTVFGTLLEKGDDNIKVESTLGEITISFSKIKGLASERPGEEWFFNPNQVRLFFAPTGRCLKKGEGYFSDIMIFFPSINYGITDNISMGAGMSIFPGLDFDQQFFFFTPKIGFKTSENLSLALGSFILTFPNDFDIDNDNITTGLLFGMMTYGDENRSISCGLGTGFVEDDFADKPLVIVGGEYRLSRKLSFVTENWVMPGVDGGLISGGIRFFGPSMAADFALFSVVAGDDSSPTIPYLDFVFFFDI